MLASNNHNNNRIMLPSMLPSTPKLALSFVIGAILLFSVPSFDHHSVYDAYQALSASLNLPGTVDVSQGRIFASHVASLLTDTTFSSFLFRGAAHVFLTLFATYYYGPNLALRAENLAYSPPDGDFRCRRPDCRGTISCSSLPYDTLGWVYSLTQPPLPVRLFSSSCSACKATYFPHCYEFKSSPDAPKIRHYLPEAQTHLFMSTKQTFFRPELFYDYDSSILNAHTPCVAYVTTRNDFWEKILNQIPKTTPINIDVPEVMKSIRSLNRTRFSEGYYRWLCLCFADEIGLDTTKMNLYGTNLENVIESHVHKIDEAFERRCVPVFCLLHGLSFSSPSKSHASLPYYNRPKFQFSRWGLQHHCNTPGCVTCSVWDGHMKLSRWVCAGERMVRHLGVLVCVGVVEFLQILNFSSFHTLPIDRRRSSLWTRPSLRSPTKFPAVTRPQAPSTPSAPPALRTSMSLKTLVMQALQ